MCPDTNPCSQHTSPCLDHNPCYEDCGCLNPTTFACLTKPGTYACLGVNNNMNGLQVLAAINDKICSLSGGDSDPSSDKYVRISSNDTTSNYLASKLIVGNYLTTTVINPGANEQYRLNVVPSTLVSTDAGNAIDIGTDGKLRAIIEVPTPDVSVIAGSGVTVTGSGPSSDPFIVSINPSISVVRPCFDNTWRSLIPSGPAVSPAGVTYVSGNPQYRYRFDGTIEFKGSITYTVVFTNSSPGRRFTFTLGSLPTTCLTLTEQAGVADLKYMRYIDYTEMTDSEVREYGYVIRKSAQNIILEFSSLYTSATTSKTIVVNFEGAVIYPNI